MARRAAYTKLLKRDQVRAGHVKGMGDVAFKGFQCLNSDCREFLFVRSDDLVGVFEVECGACGAVVRSGDETRFFGYDLLDLRDNSVAGRGEFTILHDDYVAEAQEYKYCLYCNALKPLALFDHHSGRATGRQGECNLCKAVYNGIKNQTRLTDQHREAAQKRRMYMDLSGGAKIDSKQVYERFGYACFKCGRDLRNVSDPRERPLDHTLPAYHLWPLTTETATLLCRVCNGEKAERWPSEFYTERELARLALLTGIDLEVLGGGRRYNPDALHRLTQRQFVEGLLAKYTAYMPELIKLRNRILRDTGVDFFAAAPNISDAWRRRADEADARRD